MAVPEITLESVTKKFGSVTALENVDLTIERGEFVCIIGPSGCGKTILLRLINGFERPSNGRVLIRGEPVNELPAYKRGIPTVFQNFALFPHKTVYENVEYGLNMRRVGADERRNRVERVMHLLDIPELGERYPNQISGGQKQRVGLARALVVEPFILLLDEPLGALDANLRLRMQAELKELHKRLGITFVLVTSNRTEAFAMGTRVIVMGMGMVAQVGPPETIKYNPANEYVCRFCGQTNLFPGRIDSLEGETLRIRSDLGSFTSINQGRNFKAGDRVQLFIRPEGVRIEGQDGGPEEASTPDGKSGYEENHLRAIYRHGEFGGSIVTLFFELEDGSEFQVEKHIARLGHLERKRTYDLSWQVECTGIVG